MAKCSTSEGATLVMPDVLLIENMPSTLLSITAMMRANRNFSFTYDAMKCSIKHNGTSIATTTLDTKNNVYVLGQADTHERMEKPYEYAGWICRNGFAAINLQATVDGRGRFMEYSLRPGSCGDKNVWHMSSLGRRVQAILPAYMHLIDAGDDLRITDRIDPYLGLHVHEETWSVQPSNRETALHK
ncbi:hypothetical protein H257_18221 [Aphanomyces astaci]|uniref:DDE Tnp4 domain-containing protein n=1 Tax=Aphanomyces astaci TaxID=112090 RepID=W4FDK9_APHAT|nr:hypothetical protein H257_18221 [Aphanomyces astaci]ETV64979.1 hypothetical protein H257_18221 [Aphanomyces astaci]|eukprot:XP_009845542.1 hypothetical protein H257_18221 [Aphanomyces astaci]